MRHQVSRYLFACLLSLICQTGSLRAAAAQELSFQFDYSGTPAAHVFVLKWPSADANLASIDVVDAEKKKIIQTIVPPAKALRLIYQEVARSGAVSPLNPKEMGPATPTVTASSDKIIDALDYNFDNMPDLRIVKMWPYRAGRKAYLIYLYDAKSKTYQLHQELSALPAVVPNLKTKRLESTTFEGFAGSAFTTKYFSIDSGNKLTIEAEASQQIKDEKKLIFTRAVKLREKDQLQRVCTAIVLAEGEATQVTGRRQVCDQYFRKN